MNRLLILESWPESALPRHQPAMIWHVPMAPAIRCLARKFDLVTTEFSVYESAGVPLLLERNAG